WRVQGRWLEIPEPGQGPAEGPGEGSSAAAGVVRDPVRRLTREQRDRTASGLDAALHRERGPRARLLVFADTIGVASRMAEGGHGGFAGLGPADIDHGQPQGPPDRGVGAISRTENPEGAIDAYAGPDGAVDHDERRRKVSGGGHSMEREGGIASRLDRRQHHREILGA